MIDPRQYLVDGWTADIWTLTIDVGGRPVRARVTPADAIDRESILGNDPRELIRIESQTLLARGDTVTVNGSAHRVVRTQSNSASALNDAWAVKVVSGNDS